ncbi:Fc receptor-like protein 5 [Chelonoidis abingdonii]|uniref:Fc receptor-like protein 5 n=1 Tax=Chelonoidis abingdonii TaxID=106734 RepID=UPI003F497352
MAFTFEDGNNLYLDNIMTRSGNLLKRALNYSLGGDILSKANSDHIVTGFQFSRAAGEIISYGNSDTHTLSYVTPIDTRSYTCAYWVEPSDRRMKSVESPAVYISVTDPPPAPKLSRDPDYTVYLPGERVTLKCTAPRDKLASGYKFFYQGQQDPSEVQHPNEGARLELTAQKGNAGTYTCVYWRWESNREISSRNSSSVSITVTDPPPAPTLSPDHVYTVYLPGERVTLTCSAPGHELDWRYRFFHQGQQDLSEVQHPNEGARLELTAQKGNAGTYTCAYWRWESNREISSRNSSSVSITVTAHPLAFTLSPDHGYTVYLPGERATLTCLVPQREQVSGDRFFYQKGQQDPSVVLSTNAGTWLELCSPAPQAGVYTCESWKRESDREITSKRSRPISIAVTDPVPAPKLTMSPQQPVYITGEAVTLTCSATGAPMVSGVRFLRDDQIIHSKELPSPQYSYSQSFQLPEGSGLLDRVYSCESWKTVSGRAIPSERSQPISITAQLARALFDNVAECPEELSFRRGDLMLVLQPEVPGLAGWHLCSLHGQQGIVPANRVHVLPKPGPPDLSPAPRKESASAALYNPPRGQRSSSAGQKEEQQEVYVVPPPTRPCPPPCDDIYKVPRATWRDRDPWKNNAEKFQKYFFITKEV